MSSCFMFKAYRGLDIYLMNVESGQRPGGSAPWNPHRVFTLDHTRGHEAGLGPKIYDTNTLKEEIQNSVQLNLRRKSKQI